MPKPLTIVDLSHTLDAHTSVYPGDLPYSCTPHITHAEHGCSVHALSLSTHSGTHIDAPFHFFPSGATIDALPPSAFVGRAAVADLTAKGARARISAADLAPALAALPSAEENPILLLRTGWAAHWRTPRYADSPFLERAAAEAIVRAGVRVVAIDTFSPDEVAPDGGKADAFAAHEVLLGAGVLIAENLANLEALGDGAGWMVSLMPLKVSGGDGAPIRAFAWRTL